MNNQEILRKIVNYIENVMKEKSLTSRDLADICVKKTGKMSPRTIDNMFKTPSSTTLSTLLKVCDGLDLNLNAVFHSIEIAKHQLKMDSIVSSSTSSILHIMVTPEIIMYSFFQPLLIQKIIQVKPWFMEHFVWEISILCMNAPLYLTLILAILQMKVPHFLNTMREL